MKQKHNAKAKICDSSGRISIPASWIYALEDEYKPSDDIFSEDDILYSNLKKIICNDLNETERRIILSYAEIGNIRDTAKLFRVSPTTIWNQIKNIRIKIIKLI